MTSAARIARAAARCLRSTRATSAVEFALLAPVFIACVLLIVEGGRMNWTQEVLNEVAASSARCMAVGGTQCTDATTTTAFARARAADWGVGMASATITATDDQTCNAVTGMNKVTISLPYSSATGRILPGAPNALRASACYPPIS